MKNSEYLESPDNIYVLLLFFKKSKMVNFMYQLSWAQGYPQSW